MELRPLGASGLHVPPVSFGAYAIGGGYWGPCDEDAAVAALRASFDAGVTSVDTAPVYGFGLSEELLGRALAGRRDEVQVMTKVGVVWEDLTGADQFTMPDQAGAPRPVERNGRPASVRRELEASLARLGIERVDLIQVHAPDPRVPIGETVGALGEAVRDGLARAVGVSNTTVAELAEARRALCDLPLACGQEGLNLLERGIEGAQLPWCRENGVGMLTYASMAQGLLTGRATPDRALHANDGRAQKVEFRPENLRRIGAALAAGAGEVAAARGVTVAQVSLAWTHGAPGVTSSLAGARTPEQARENAAAGALALTDEERARIEAPFATLELERPKRSLLGRVRERVKRALR